jgi:hypothetical protein
MRVNSRAEILPTYRLVTPAVCAISEKIDLRRVLSNPAEPLKRLFEDPALRIAGR